MDKIFIPPGPLSGATAATLQEMLIRLSRLLPYGHPEPPVLDFHGGLFTENNAPEEALRIRITDVSGAPYYAWEEVWPESYSGTAWTRSTLPQSGTATSTPAVEVNGNTVQLDTVVYARRACIDTGTTKGWIYEFHAPIALANVISGNYTLNGVTLTLTNQSVINSGTTGAVGTTPPGYISPPTLTVAGAPTWTPVAGTYPFVWNSATSILYWWNGGTWSPVGGNAAGWEWHRHRGTTPFSRYHICGTHGSVGTKSTLNTLNVDTIYAVPMVFPGGGVVDSIAVELVSNASNMIFAIYEDAGAGDAFPGARVYSSGVVAVNAGAPKLATCAPAFTPDVGKLYWFAIVFDSNTTIATFSDIAPDRVPDIMGWKGGATGFSSDAAAWLAVGRAWDGTLPATFPAVAEATDLKMVDYMPMIGVRYSS